MARPCRVRKGCPSSRSGPARRQRNDGIAFYGTLTPVAPTLSCLVLPVAFVRPPARHCGPVQTKVQSSGAVLRRAAMGSGGEYAVATSTALVWIHSSRMSYMGAIHKARRRQARFRLVARAGRGRREHIALYCTVR